MITKIQTGKKKRNVENLENCVQEKKISKFHPSYKKCTKWRYGLEQTNLRWEKWNEIYGIPHERQKDKQWHSSSII